ncbi:unnamed protein product [Soboliphyme baturini]|uniref:Mitochondrial 2-oxoglutarate/malate carrier protein n=1 Tax=Soboliphyme baturini TaxID=241478 RepID=A0A183IJY0_9BILA|nr:unnamed protein product [Soboliphyme baturini]
MAQTVCIPDGLKFAFGGAAGMMATMVVQPLDLIKNRMQMLDHCDRRITSPQMVRKILANEGLFALYNGLSAGLFRQATYTTARLGAYNFLMEYFSQPGYSSFSSKILMGITAGAIGAVIGTPAEVCLIRMTSDGRLPLNQRRNYKSVFNALYRITSEEGLLSLWRGCRATVFRAMVLNAGQLATYSQAKQYLLSQLRFKDDVACHFLSSMISAFAATVISMPVDIGKTRIQNMKMVDGIPEYKSMIDVWKKVVRSDGVLALWKGFTPYFMRLGPHTVLTFVFLEQMNGYYRHWQRGTVLIVS